MRTPIRLCRIYAVHACNRSCDCTRHARVAQHICAVRIMPDSGVDAWRHGSRCTLQKHVTAGHCLIVPGELHGPPVTWALSHLLSRCRHSQRTDNALVQTAVQHHASAEILLSCACVHNPTPLTIAGSSFPTVGRATAAPVAKLWLHLGFGGCCTRAPHQHAGVR